MHLTMRNRDTHFFDLKIIFWLNAGIRIIGMLVFLLIISENSFKKWLLVMPAFSILYLTYYLNGIFMINFLGWLANLY